MSIQAGTHQIGPGNGSLTIKTGREGAAAKAGHDLVLEAKSWDGTVEIGDDASVKLSVDPSSIEVQTGSGGAKPLDLSLAGSSKSIRVPLSVGDDGTVRGSIRLSQSESASSSSRRSWAR